MVVEGFTFYVQRDTRKESMGPKTLNSKVPLQCCVRNIINNEIIVEIIIIDSVIY